MEADMPKFIVECKETRTHVVEVEADDEDEAWEIVETQFPEGSKSDQFDSLEKHAVYLAGHGIR
jgi:hypothetical protein